MNAACDPPSVPGLHLMAKPAGPACNLDCRYCFYLEKEKLFPPRHRFLMSDEVLRRYIEQNIAAEPSPEVVFTWQGGEPMLRGLDFFKRAVAWQRELAAGKTISNALQTNGVLLDDEWCGFLAQAGFLVGISLDGPEEIHDRYRVDKNGGPSFAAVMRGIELLRKHGIEFNVLVSVHDAVAERPRDVYRFLKAAGATHIQFSPVVERVPTQEDALSGLAFAAPPRSGPGRWAGPGPAVTAQSVAPAAYGKLLSTVFDEWVRKDVGKVYVMNFEWALAAWLGLPATICLFAEECGRSLILEHNGDVYSCDHFMYPDYLLGNLQESSLRELGESARQKAFGAAKSRDLPAFCRECEYRFACAGECPKNRFAVTPQGEPGLNYLCPGYKKFFAHITADMQAMGGLIKRGLPASLIMEMKKGKSLAMLPARKA